MESHVRDTRLAFILNSPTDVKFIVDETLDFGGLSPSDRYCLFILLTFLHRCLCL